MTMKSTSGQEFNLDEVMEKIRAEVSRKGHSRQQPQAEVAPEETRNPVLLTLRPVVNFSYRIPLIGPVFKRFVAAMKERLLSR